MSRERKKAGCFVRIFLVPWEWGQGMRRRGSRWSATELGRMLGNYTWRDGGRGEDMLWLKLPASFLGVPVGLGAGVK